LTEETYMAQPIWNPEHYLSFAGKRLRPAVDLLGRVALGAPKTVYDLGCGPGNVTPLLRARWPDATLVGLDHSPEMLARARATHADADDRIRWVQADAADWAPEAPATLIYSNAALHWLDDHAALFPRLMGGLAPGGVLAVQMPRNHGEPSHTGIVDTVNDGPWAAKLRPLLRERPVHDPGSYYDALTPHTRGLEIWETIYAQPMEGDDPVARWTKGSALKPFLDALDEPDRGRFYAAYAARMRAAYPERPDGRTLFPFRRLFIIATR